MFCKLCFPNQGCCCLFVFNYCKSCVVLALFEKKKKCRTLNVCCVTWQLPEGPKHKKSGSTPIDFTPNPRELRAISRSKSDASSRVTFRKPSTSQKRQPGDISPEVSMSFTSAVLNVCAPNFQTSKALPKLTLKGKPCQFLPHPFFPHPCLLPDAKSRC